MEEKRVERGGKWGRTWVYYFPGKNVNLAYLCGFHLPNKGIFNSSLRFLGIIFLTLKQTPP